MSSMSVRSRSRPRSSGVVAKVLRRVGHASTRCEALDGVVSLEFCEPCWHCRLHCKHGPYGMKRSCVCCELVYGVDLTTGDDSEWSTSVSLKWLREYSQAVAQGPRLAIAQMRSDVTCGGFIAPKQQMFPWLHLADVVGGLEGMVVHFPNGGDMPRGVERYVDKDDSAMTCPPPASVTSTVVARCKRTISGMDPGDDVCNVRNLYPTLKEICLERVDEGGREVPCGVVTRYRASLEEVSVIPSPMEYYNSPDHYGSGTYEVVFVANDAIGEEDLVLACQGTRAMRVVGGRLKGHLRCMHARKHKSDRMRRIGTWYGEHVDQRIPDASYGYGKRINYIVALGVTLMLCSWGIGAEAAQRCVAPRGGTVWEWNEVDGCAGLSGQKIGMVDVYGRDVSVDRRAAVGCRIEDTEYLTMTSFFGGKGITNLRRSSSYVGSGECRTWNSSGVARGCPIKWDGNVGSCTIGVVAYRWCCSEEPSVVTTMYIHRGVVAIEPDAIAGGYGDMSRCNPTHGECQVGDTSVVWGGSPPRRCGASLIGSGVGYSYGGTIMVPNLGVAVTASNTTVDTCLGRLNRTLQGLFITVRKRVTRDLEDGVGNYHMAVLRMESDQIRSMLCNVYSTVRKLQGLALRMDPTTGMRLLLRRDDIAAETVGEAVLVWECERVEIVTALYNRRNGSVCYHDVPVEYRDSGGVKHGFLQDNGLDVVDVSRPIDCRHTRGYYHKGGRGWEYWHGLHEMQRVAAPRTVEAVSIPSAGIHTIVEGAVARARVAHQGVLAEQVSAMLADLDLGRMVSASQHGDAMRGVTWAESVSSVPMVGQSSGEAALGSSWLWHIVERPMQIGLNIILIIIMIVVVTRVLLWGYLKWSSNVLECIKKKGRVRGTSEEEVMLEAIK